VQGKRGSEKRSEHERGTLQPNLVTHERMRPKLLENLCEPVGDEESGGADTPVGSKRIIARAHI
jgi:hypothetical protein